MATAVDGTKGLPMIAAAGAAVCSMREKSDEALHLVGKR